MRRRRGASWTLGVAVSVVALAAVAWWISRQDAPRLPESAAGFAWLGLAVAISACTPALRGWRWHRIMRDADVPHRRRDAYGLTLVAYMGNNVLPVRGGELLKIGMMGARTPARTREVLGTVIVERVLDGAVLVGLLVLFTLAGVTGAAAGGEALRWAGLLLGAAVAALAVYLRLRRRGRFERFAAAIRPVAGASKLLLRREGIVLGLASLVVWCLEGLTFAAITRAVDVDLGVLAATAVVALASLAAAIPAAPGYVGTFDAGILLGLSAAGVEGGAAVGALLLARFVWFVPVTLVGLGTLVFGYGGLRRPPGDDEELLAEHAPGERRREVPARERGAGR